MTAEEDERRSSKPLVAAAIVFVVSALFAAVVVLHLEQQRIGVKRAETGELATGYADALQREIERTLSITSTFAALIRQGGGRIPDFQVTARELLPYYPSASAVHLAPDGVVREVFPSADNARVVGLDLLAYPARTKEAVLARDSGRLTLAGPYTLVQDGLGAVGRLPVFLDDVQGRRFWGFVSVVLRVPETIQTAGLAQLAQQGFDYKLTRLHPDTGLIQIFAESSEQPLDRPVEHDLAVPNGTWTLGLSPAKGWDAPIALVFPIGLGLVLSLLLAILTKLLMDARRLQAELARMVDSRTTQLRARESDLERAEEIAQVGSWDFDISSNRATASAVACRITGVQPDTPFSLQRFLEQVHPLDRAPVETAWQAALRGEPYDVEHRALVEGRLRWLRQRAVLEFDIDGRALRAAGTVEDITERKTAEQALSDSESRLRRIVETAREGIWTIDGETRTTFVNPRMAELLGCPAEQIIGRSPFDFMDPEMRRLVERKLIERRQGNTDQYELRLTRPDGSQLWTLLSTTPLRDVEGRYIGTLGMLTDISARKRAEAVLDRERSLLKQAERIAQFGSWEWDVAHDRWTFSEGWMSIYGVDGQAPDAWHDIKATFFHPEDRGAIQDAMDAALEGRRPFDVVHRIIRHCDGGTRRVHAFGEVIRDNRGQALILRGVTQDITGRAETEAELRIAAIAFEAQEGMVVTDAEERILRVNKAFTEITGYTTQESIGATPRLLRSGRHGADFFAAMWKQIREQGFWEGEIWNRRKTGEIFPEWLIITAVKDDRGRVTHYVGTLTDISQRKEAEEAVRRLAFYDPLTGLPNRRLLLDRLNQTLAAAARQYRDGALIFIDLDNFKQINDTRGHQIGDLLLEEVARRLTATMRKSDSVARLGGDEFVVLLPDLGEDPALAAALAEGVGEKILSVLGMPYILAGEEYVSTPSLGIAMFNRGPQTADDILKQADLAMYQAKAAGRNRLRFFDPKMQASANQRAALERELRLAIGEGQLVLHYQPQVDTQGRVTGAEALLRWRHPERGLVAPAQFIGVAETLGLTLQLGRWVLASACAQLAEWATRPETAALSLSVNISGAHFRRPELVADVRRALEESGADPGRLRLELTESPLLDDPEDTLVKMSALKETGVGFTLDNFGVGYCSLSYLKRLPIDRLKIAPAFVREVLKDSEDDAIADSFVALAESLGLAIMAEGVETEAQRDYLVHHGCQTFQGFLFGRPGPVDALFAAQANGEEQGADEAGPCPGRPS